MSLRQPAASPPAWAFGAAASGLSLPLGFAAWLVWRAQTAAPVRLPAPSRASRALRPLRLWGWHLLAAALWAPLFFAGHAPLAALLLAALPALLVLAACARAFWRVRPAAVCLLLPSAAWTCYTVWLTAGVWWLDPLP